MGIKLWWTQINFKLVNFFRMSGDSATVDSEMSTSVNSDASLDIDIVRHHDGIGTFSQTDRTVCNPTFPVATSTANLLDTRDFDTETDSEDDLSQFGRSKIVRKLKFWKRKFERKKPCFSPTEWEVLVWRERMACTPGWACPGWSCISCLSCSSSTRGNPLASPWCASDSDGDGLVMNLINISNTNHTFYWLWPLRAFIANVCLLRHQHGYMIFQQSFPSDHIIHQQIEAIK